MGIPDHCTCFLWNVCSRQEATVRTRDAKWTSSKLKKEYIKAVYCHPAYFMQSTSCEMSGWMNHKLESRLQGELSTASDMQISDMQISYLRYEGERGKWKSWLKTQHSKNGNHDIRFHLLLVNRWGRSVNNERFYFLGLKNHCGQGLQPQN